MIRPGVDAGSGGPRRFRLIASPGTTGFATQHKVIATRIQYRLLTCARAIVFVCPKRVTQLACVPKRPLDGTSLVVSSILRRRVGEQLAADRDTLMTSPTSDVADTTDRLIPAQHVPIAAHIPPPTRRMQARMLSMLTIDRRRRGCVTGVAHDVPPFSWSYSHGSVLLRGLV